MWLSPRSTRRRDVRAIYQTLPLIGTPHYLAEDATLGDRSSQRSGELWTEVRFDPAIPDAYRHTMSAQPLHTDGSYIETYPNATLMCCINNSAEGGETVFITARQLIGALSSKPIPNCSNVLEHPVPHARSGDTRTFPVIRDDAGTLKLNWNYYCVAEDRSADVSDLREQLFQVLRESEVVLDARESVRLNTGDAVVWKDDEVLHGRNSFVAKQAGDRFLWKAAVDVGVFK
ncbi:MAG: TauD/TfdA family dioxygenase [Polyangiaceae bacterium]